MAGQLPSIHPPGPPLSYPTPTTYDSAPPPSSTLSPQSPSGGLPAMGMLGPQLMGRGENESRASFSQPMQMPSTPDERPRFGSEYESMLLSPSQSGEPFGVNRMMPGNPNLVNNLPGGTVQGHKRAYRQRRKDPSCDACRERKVKCDATDTSSCSECSSRNVKCQFTKETNRRMSSIKQVQDLEKQLLVARQQVSQLQSMISPDGAAVEDDETPERQPGPNKRRKLTLTHDFSTVQRKIQQYGNEIIAAPPTLEQPRSSAHPQNGHELPPKNVCETLLQQLHVLAQSPFAFFYLPDLPPHLDLGRWEQLHDKLPSDSRAVLFAAFACGSLQGDCKGGREYHQVAKNLLDLWTESPSLDLIRAALLSSAFLVETSSRSAAFMMMGYAVRAAQEIGLHQRVGIRSDDVEEARYQLWWALYSNERALAYQLGRPSMINDEDCGLMGERPLQSPGGVSSTRLETMVKMARMVPHLQRAFKTPIIPPVTIQSLEEQISRCMPAFPSNYQLGAPSQPGLDTAGPVVYAQSARILLHRHNLSPVCSLEARSAAIDTCMIAARDTARALSRIMQEPSPSTPESATPSRWEESLVQASSAFFCLHVWRCALFLSACGDFEGALICARAGSAVGSARPINRACGRYLEFFLQVLHDRKQGERISLEEDHEVLAYLSGDLQSNLDEAWIWNSTAKESSREVEKEEVCGGKNQQQKSPKEENPEEWDGWTRVIAKLQNWLDERRQHQQLSPTGTGPLLTTRLDTTVPSVAQVSPSNRMSIADII